MIYLPSITDLKTLLKSMKPKLIDHEFVFCTLPYESLPELKIDPLLIFREQEGATIIIEKESADANSLPYSMTWAQITLTVHSDLEAVGFLAAITARLAKSGISVNPVSAYHHDHLFVPYEKKDKALKLLEEQSSSWD
ncbi:MAG: ACT domain-containing protein [archaeon]